MCGDDYGHGRVYQVWVKSKVVDTFQSHRIASTACRILGVLATCLSSITGVPTCYVIYIGVLATCLSSITGVPSCYVIYIGVLATCLSSISGVPTCYVKYRRTCDLLIKYNCGSHLLYYIYRRTCDLIIKYNWGSILLYYIYRRTCDLLIKFVVGIFHVVAQCCVCHIASQSILHTQDHDHRIVLGAYLYQRRSQGRCESE